MLDLTKKFELTDSFFRCGVARDIDTGESSGDEYPDEPELDILMVIYPANMRGLLTL